jgi:flavin reductase (DIM6/NTAB) family NADH-FMN oxidoreductase RutF
VPILAGVRAWMLAAVEHRFHVAGQVVLVGRVLRTATGDVGPPLLYHDGRFRRLGGDAGRLRVLDHGARDRSA